MTRQEFWDLLGPPGDEDNRFKRIVKALAGMGDEEILSFRWHFHAMTRHADRFTLRGVAYLVDGGGSEDGYFYFREWLVERGQAIYERALVDPDTLAVVLTGEEVEPLGLYYAARQAWEPKGGAAGTEAEFERRFMEYYQQHPWEPPDAGEEFDFTDPDKLSRRFPRLDALY